ncbi:SDR family oxidoreductase [Babesia caballi]|uniref:SDR family oxidoreductase n=1 Tax=Babesia caballi TaxID=5871 RepID=A0AAV4LS41_BABCB|nr:SDR family oxidoreductase [Babesia caballi]
MYERSVLVTGCDSGLGLALCGLLPRNGHFVIATCRTEEGRLLAFKALNNQPHSADIHPAVDSAGWLLCDGGACHLLDVTSLTAVEEFREDVVRRIANKTFPNLHSLVNNAGIWRFSLLRDTFASAASRQAEIERWKDVLDTNLLGALRMTAAFAGSLAEAADGSKPRVVFISSVLDRHALPGQGAYVASKFALTGLYETLCHELSCTNIVPIIIRPGALRNTKLFHQDLDLDESVQPCTPQTESDILKASYRILLNVAGDCNGVAQTVLQALQDKHPKFEYSNVVGSLPFKLAEYVPRGLFVTVVRTVLRNLARLYFGVVALFRGWR